MNFWNRVVCSTVLMGSAAGYAYAQQSQDPPIPQGKTAGQVEREAAGSEVADPGPLATDLSPKLDSKEIRKAMRKVADWQLRTKEDQFNRQWTYATLYDGLIDASATTSDPKYRDAVAHAAADKWQWKLIDSRFPHADDEALGKAYIALNKLSPAPEKIADTRATMDRLVARPDDPAKNVWWWCDALYMAPAVLAETARSTGDRKYLDYMDHEWDLATKELYDPREHLFTRDGTFLTKKEANGRKLFWARGNGWVVGGLVRVLNAMPAGYPARPKYEQQFKDMVETIAALQQPDGMWRTGLLDQGAYKASEVSGTAFFTYAMAWGINTGRLPRAKYLPIVTKAWAGMVSHIYADGRLGAIQPIGAAPDSFTAGSSYVYGVGGFLMAGSELDKLIRKR